MQTSASGPGDGVAPPAHDSDDVSTSATGPSGASSAPTSVPAGDSTTINLSAAPPGVPTPLSGSAGTAAAAPALQQEDNDLKATLLLFRHLDFCSLGDIGDLIKEFSDNLSARFNAITLRSDLKQYVRQQLQNDPKPTVRDVEMQHAGKCLSGLSESVASLDRHLAKGPKASSIRRVLQRLKKIYDEYPRAEDVVDGTMRFLQAAEKLCNIAADAELGEPTDEVAGRFLSSHVLRPLLEFIGAWDDRLRADLAARIAECRRLRDKASKQAAEHEKAVNVQAWLEQKREILKIGETAVKAALKQHDLLRTAIRPSRQQLMEYSAAAEGFLDLWQRNYTGPYERYYADLARLRSNWEPTQRRQTATRKRLEADVKYWEGVLQKNSIQKKRIREEIQKLFAAELDRAEEFKQATEGLALCEQRLTEYNGAAQQLVVEKEVREQKLLTVHGMFQKAQELVAKMRDLNAFLTTGIQKALDSRTRDVAVERKRIVAECNKLIDQQLAGLNEHLEKYIRKEQALQETERALREQISSAFDFCLTGEEVANLEVQLDKMHMALEQTVVSKKNIYQAIDDVMKHRARVGVN